MSFKHSNIFEIHGHLQFKLLTRIYFSGSSEFSPEVRFSFMTLWTVGTGRFVQDQTT